MREMFRVGLISDTHGLLRPAAVEFLRGSVHIIHAGDICDPDAIGVLSSIAPVSAVRGNNDKGHWAAALRETELVDLEGLRICVIHDLADLKMDLVQAGVQVVVSGHAHKPHVRERDGVLYVNPGSAGPRRFRLPVAAAELLVENGRVTARIHEFPPGA